VAGTRGQLTPENVNKTAKINVNKKYGLSNSESVHCNFFIFGHVTFIQFKICCCVQNFTKIRWFFAEIQRYIDFQNGGRPPSWNCFTAIRDHPRSLCCWPQLPVKFHVNLTHRSEDIAISIFRIFGSKYLLRPQNGGFEKLLTPKCDYSSSRPPKGTSLRKSVSFKLLTVKKNPLRCLTCRRVDRKCDGHTDTDTHTHIGKFIA